MNLCACNLVSFLQIWDINIEIKNMHLYVHEIRDKKIEIKIWICMFMKN